MSMLVESEEKLRSKILVMTIEELDLCVRSYNCLKRAGINNVEELIDKTPAEVSNIRNLPTRCYEEIVNKLKSMGLCLKGQSFNTSINELEDEADLLLCEEDKWEVNESLNLKFLQYLNDSYYVKGIDACSARHIVIPSVYLDRKVTRIFSCAFKNQTSIISVTIPEGVFSIGRFAFSGCTSLTQVNIPEGMLRIQEGAFAKCTSLVSVCIPKTVTVILYNTFRSSGLESIVIPSSIESIRGGAFKDCTSLKDIYFDGTIQQWGAIRKSDHWDDCTGDYTIHCIDGTISKEKSTVERLTIMHELWVRNFSNITIEKIVQILEEIRINYGHDKAEAKAKEIRLLIETGISAAELLQKLN